MIEEDCHGRARNRSIDIAVSEYNIRRFAAEFERNLFQVSSRSLHNQLADFSRAGERDLVDIWMRSQCSSGSLAVSGNNVHHTIRDSSFLNQFAQPQRRKR